jgi:hypothetical protein
MAAPAAKSAGDGRKGASQASMSVSAIIPSSTHLTTFKVQKAINFRK